jgi:hypothetical protein
MRRTITSLVADSGAKRFSIASRDGTVTVASATFDALVATFADDAKAFRSREMRVRPDEARTLLTLPVGGTYRGLGCEETITRIA